MLGKDKRKGAYDIGYDFGKANGHNNNDAKNKERGRYHEGTVGQKRFDNGFNDALEGRPKDPSGNDKLNF